MDLDLCSDADLLRRFREAGDRGALSALLERHRDLAYRVALGVLGDPTDAEDAAQDALVSLLAYEPRVRLQDSLTGLVARMALRAAQHHTRSRGRRRAREAIAALPEDAADGDPFDVAAQRETERAVREAVHALDDRYRLPLLLCYYEGLSTRETAEALGITQTAVTTRLSRAVGKLRGRLAREGRVLALPALVTLLRPRQAVAAPASLVERLRDLANTTSAVPSTTVAAAAGGVAAWKFAWVAAAVASVLTVGAIGATRSLLLPDSTRAAGPRIQHRAAPPAVASQSGGLSQAPATPVTVQERERPLRLASSDGATGKTPRRTAAGTHPRGFAVPGGSEPYPRTPARPHVPSQAKAAQAAQPPVSPSPMPPAGLPTAMGATRVATLAGAAVGDDPSARPLTIEEERRLAADVAVQVWHDSAAAGHDERESLLMVLGAIDPPQATALAKTRPGDAGAEAARWALLGELWRPDPGSAAARLDITTDSDVPILAALARRHAAKNPVVAAALLGRVVDLARAADDPAYAPIDLAHAASLAAELGDPRAAALGAEALRRLPEALRAPVDGWQPSDARTFVGEEIAYQDPGTALRLLADIRGSDARRDALRRVLPNVARRDPAAARAALDAARNEQSTLGPTDWCLLATRVAAGMAATDPDAAAALARSLPARGDAVHALVRVAARAPEPKAATLRREMLALAREMGPTNAILLLPPIPERREACIASLGGRGDASDNLTHAMEAGFLLAPVDAALARLILEDALATCADMGNRPHLLGGIAVAMVAVDPRQALALASRLPHGNPERWDEPNGQRTHVRFDALRAIAAYLATPREERAALRFHGTVSGDDWMLQGDPLEEDGP